MSDEYVDVFKEEASELLEELEEALLEWENNLENLTVVGRIFRSMHTIKGSGAMFGFDDIAEFTHHVESVLDKVRGGEITGNKELVSLVFVSRDHIQAMLEAASGNGEVEPEAGEKIISALKVVTKNAIAKKSPAFEVEEVQHEANEHHSTSMDLSTYFRICFRPTVDFFNNGGDVEAIINDLKILGDLEITGQVSQKEAQEHGSMCHWDFLLCTKAHESIVRSTFILAENNSEIIITNIGHEDENSFPEHQKLGDILVEKGELQQEKLDITLKEHKQLGVQLVDSDIVSPEKVESALNEQKVLAAKRIEKSSSSESLRVSSNKLDYLINLVGEMVVTQARLSDVALNSKCSNLKEPVEEVERLTAELRDCVLNIRMMPIGTTFSRYKRLVRDLSKNLCKEVDLIMEGSETEIDKSVIDLLSDPLIHLIRNSIDHGVELPDERVALGKAQRGTIKLSAEHSGANVIIKIIDDGKGLDTEVIKAKAYEKGLISKEQELDNGEIFDLIFGAGVSTAQEVTDVSGRGVGMDVVKNTIEGRLKGSIKVDSEHNIGTTITISLPLTLAIIDGLLVKVCDTYFVLPLSQVEECVELTTSDIEKFHGRHVFPVRNQLVSYVSLREFYRLNGDSLDLQQMVIVNINDQRIGLVLDEVVGGHQTVIKSLGWVYKDAEGVSGATILGNGEVALIIDVANLVRHAQLEESNIQSVC